jgi:hypothetical protein
VAYVIREIGAVIARDREVQTALKTEVEKFAGKVRRAAAVHSRTGTYAASIRVNRRNRYDWWIHSVDGLAHVKEFGRTGGNVDRIGRPVSHSRGVYAFAKALGKGVR